ncbi:MAG: RNA polymerase sigma factor [Planctomycetota bacterium]|nr:MAG: RNA polymerase sigma factor [Planctomycetota bacterium]
MGGGSRDLLARSRDGDRAALAELVGSMGPRLKGFFLRLGAQEATAEDLTQDVFLRVLQSMDRYQESGRLDAYLLRIARNLWIDRRRRVRPAAAAEVLLEVPDPVEPGPSERAGTRDRAERIRRVLAGCDPATRELLELAVLQRLPYVEVGRILDIPVGTVKSRVHYALRRLRETLVESGLEEEA